MTDKEASNDPGSKDLTDYAGWGPSDHANADLKIISSDDRSFWVSSTQLIHHSPIFASMLATCNDTSEDVQLADPDIESARSFECVFQIIASIDVDNRVHSTISTYLCPPVVLFAQKYDMKLVLATIRGYLFSLSAEYPPRGTEYCLEAAHMSEWALCGRLIASVGHDDCAGWPCRTVRKMLDPRGWTPEIMDELNRVSTRFAWAVYQTGTKHGGSGPRFNHVNYENMGEDLARLMIMTQADAEEEVAAWNGAVPSWLNP